GTHSCGGCSTTRNGRACAGSSRRAASCQRFWWPRAGTFRSTGRLVCARLHNGCTSLRSEEHTSELQSPCNIVCRLLLEKKKGTDILRQESTDLLFLRARLKDISIRVLPLSVKKDYVIFVQYPSTSDVRTYLRCLSTLSP